MNVIFKITLFNICFFAFTVQALALAGWAEFDYDLIYNKYADIYLGNPSDACPRVDWSQSCFFLALHNENPEEYLGKLEKISIPLENSPLIIAQNRDYNWFIYDYIIML